MLTAIALLALASKPTPVLVELFTSEGCSSCPSADRTLQWLDSTQPVEGVEVIVLSLHVDYWNQLGWADPFSSPRFTARQEAYGKQMYTPQMIIDGDAAFVGSKRRALEALAERKGSPRAEVTLGVKVNGASLEVAAKSDSPAPLWVAIAESGLSHEVSRGENRGLTLSHAAVVRHLVRVGANGTVSIPLEPGWKLEQLKVVAFVQEPGPGKVLGVTWIKPKA
jgi:hypothetical protein